jgi:chaperonin cofactor prefoldin
MTTVTEVDAKINAHIDICEVRYRGIEREMQGVNARLKRLEQILISGAGAIVILLITLLMKG